MTEVQMRSLFDLLQDKANDPYFTDAEKYELLNDAQVTYVNKFLGLDDGGGKEKPPKIGLNEIVDSALMPLLVQVTMSTGTTGLIDIPSMKTETVEDPILIVDKSVYTSSYIPVNYVKPGDISTIYNMEFSTPTTYNPVYTITASGWQFYPKETISDLTMSVLKMPQTIASGVNSDLPAFVHNKIVAIALQKTGLVTEDEALAMIENVTSG